MPSYNVSVVKQKGTLTWSNRYVVFTDNLAAALTAGGSIVDIEKAVHRANVAFIGMKVENTIVGSPDNRVVGLSGVGANGLATGQMPLHNTVRVSLHPESGKPSQKYLRLPLGEEQQEDGVLLESIRTFLLANYVTPLLALTAFKDVDGQTFTSGVVHPMVSPRQMDRRRRSRPGFHRGWVPN